MFSYTTFLIIITGIIAYNCYNKANKLLKVGFNQGRINKEKLKQFGEIVEINDYFCTLKVEDDLIKQTTVKLLSSDLLIEEILINENSIDDVIRKIFNDNKNI